MIPCYSAIIGRITFLHFWMRIDDANSVETLRGEIVDHFLWIGKTLVVPRERLVVVLVVNIEPDHIGGNLLLSKCIGQQSDAGLRIIAVAALVVSQRPQRR